MMMLGWYLVGLGVIFVGEDVTAVDVWRWASREAHVTFYQKVKRLHLKGKNESALVFVH